MQPARISVGRASLLVVALAAMGILWAGGDNRAAATSFNPQSSVSVSDPTPGANADLRISFSIPAPDSFTNVTDSPSIQFVPRQWGISADAPIGAIGGTYNTLSTLAVMGVLPCIFPVPVPFTMHVSSVDTSNPTSALDLPGRPGGFGFSGQFVPDPNTSSGGTTLPGGVSRYPDFLKQMFPPSEVGEPLTRMWGGANVLVSAISLNIVTFRPGQLPGYPATLGYPSVTVLLNPVAPVDLATAIVNNDLCTPLSLTNTLFGLTKDNPLYAGDQSGHVQVTNPRGEKDYTFTLKTDSQPDADNDGVENWLDTCVFNPNIEEFGRNFDADMDGLDAACDPNPAAPSPLAPLIGVPDQDGDFYPNRADNCPLTPNGIELLGLGVIQLGPFSFTVGVYGDVIGTDNQADADGDRIGDACDPDPFDVTGHVHHETIEASVNIGKHGVKLDDLSGSESIASGGSATFTVSVESKSSTAEHFPVGLRVVEGCATVDGAAGVSSTTAHVNPDATAKVNFTVDWSGCADGEYTVQADACHAGDPAPAGLFGDGACPGTPDGLVDTNPLDDAPRSITVQVGSP